MAAAALFTVSCLLAGCLGKADADAPNFVVVLTDDQAPSDLSAMPTVRRLLGAEGVTFENAFVSVPECCPSRASFLTGQYAHNHGVASNEPPDGGFQSFADENALPVWLADAGYRTGYVGKYLNLYGWNALGNDPAYVPPGWSDWAALTNHTEYQMYGYDLNIDGEIESYGDSPDDYQTDVLADHAEEFLATAVDSEQPFFLQVAPSAPHDEGVLEGEDAPRNPRPAPRDLGSYEDALLPRSPSFNEADLTDKPRFLRNDPSLSEGEEAELETLYRSRLESLQAVDRMVGEMVETLRRADELDNTVFVFTSDNGFMLGEHRLTGKGRVYDESAGVPLVVRGPGFGKALTVSTPVSNIDLTASIVEASGVEPGLALDGMPLAPLESAEDFARPPILIEMLAKREFQAVRTDRFVYAEYTEGGSELYDLEADSYELDNARRDAAYSRQKRQLESLLDQLEDCAGDGCLLDETGP